MKYRLLGKSGLRVSELCLGTMTFGEDWGWGASKDVCTQMFDAFTDLGGNFIDTANRYTNGTSERYVGELIAGDRDRYVLATKYSLNMNSGDPNAGGNHRKNIFQSLKASLKRLNTDYIDLYWLHAWDFMTPIEEVMKALDAVIQSGKVHYIGISDTPAWVISRANTLAEIRGWSPFIAMQMQYSLIQRDIEREFLPMAKDLGIGVTAWSPLGGGVLTGKYGKNKHLRDPSKQGRLKPDSARLTDRNLTIAEEVQGLAVEIGHPSTQIAINWVRQQEDGIIPILGARKFEQLKENLDCLEFTLTRDQLKRLDEVSRITLGFPYDFLNSQSVRNIIYGGTYDSIEL
jgi:aryl-alcohol dehydrogenase-like predicted oxidoreductase